MTSLIGQANIIFLNIAELYISSMKACISIKMQMKEELEKQRILRDDQIYGIKQEFTLKQEQLEKETAKKVRVVLTEIKSVDEIFQTQSTPLKPCSTTKNCLLSAPPQNATINNLSNIADSGLQETLTSCR